jgi:DNA-binding transcriptional LysR family regulator
VDKIENMKRFIAVAQTGSFTQASELLNLPKSAISVSINRLEKHLQTRLLHRSTRSVTLTESGSRYLPLCQQLLTSLESLESQFQQEGDEISGIIRVDMPGRFYSNVVAPNLHQWFAQHPRTQIRLIGADYRIDPIKERVDCVIRAGKLEDSDLIARHLGSMQMVNCISASYAQRYGIPQTLEELPQHYVVGYSPGVRTQRDGFAYHHDNTSAFIRMPCLVSVSTTDAYLTSCLAGLGIIQLPRMGVTTLLASGELLEILPQYRCEPIPVAIIYESKQHMPPRVRKFIDWLVQLVSQLTEHASHQNE